MFNAQEKRVLGQILFEAWTSPTFAAALLSDPHATITGRGIQDLHGRTFQVAFDTEITAHLIVPWLPPELRQNPAQMTQDERESQVGSTLRIDWSAAESVTMFALLTSVWTTQSVAIALLDQPRVTLEGVLAASTLAKLGGRRIVALEDSAAIVNVVIGQPPAGLATLTEDLLLGGAHILCSASSCHCLCAQALPAGANAEVGQPKAKAKGAGPKAKPRKRGA